MRFLALAVLIVAGWLLAAPAQAQCIGGVCRAPRAAVVVVAPVRRLAFGVRSRRAGRVERRVGRRMARRARRGARGRCCG
jgi:hypothetical protein